MYRQYGDTEIIHGYEKPRDDAMDYGDNALFADCPSELDSSEGLGTRIALPIGSGTKPVPGWAWALGGFVLARWFLK